MNFSTSLATKPTPPTKQFIVLQTIVQRTATVLIFLVLGEIYHTQNIRLKQESRQFEAKIVQHQLANVFGQICATHIFICSRGAMHTNPDFPYLIPSFSMTMMMRRDYVDLYKWPTWVFIGENPRPCVPITTQVKHVSLRCKSHAIKKNPTIPLMHCVTTATFVSVAAKSFPTRTTLPKATQSLYP